MIHSCHNYIWGGEGIRLLQSYYPNVILMPELPTVCPCPNLKKIYSKKKKTNSTFLNELRSHPVSKYWKQPTNSKGKTGAESHNSATNTEVLHWHTLLLPSLTTEMYKSLPGSVHKNQYWTSFNSTDDKLHLWGKTSHKEGRGKSKKIWHQQNI